MTDTTTAAPTTPTTLVTGHVGLSVTDVDRSKTFYEQVFGFATQSEGTEPDRRWAFLGRDGKVLVTLWQQSAAAFDTAPSGLHHLSFQVDSIDDVRSVEARLHDLSADLIYDGVVPHGEGIGSGGIFFHDPDGIRLEVYAPSGADTAEAPTAGAPTCGFF